MNKLLLMDRNCEIYQLILNMMMHVQCRVEVGKLCKKRRTKNIDTSFC